MDCISCVIIEKNIFAMSITQSIMAWLKWYYTLIANDHEPKNESNHRHNGSRPSVRQSTCQPRGWLRECLNKPFMKHRRKARFRVSRQFMQTYVVGAHSGRIWVVNMWAASLSFFSLISLNEVAISLLYCKSTLCISFYLLNSPSFWFGLTRRIWVILAWSGSCLEPIE